MELDDIRSQGFIESDGNLWSERRHYVLKDIYTNMSKLIEEAKDKNICKSIAVFKPNEILDFTYEKVESDWEPQKTDLIKSQNAQLNLFTQDSEEDIENFELVNKVPYKFKFNFKDESGKISNMMIEDWETGMLYWNSLNKHNGDETKACEDVKKKYFENFAKTKDYYFILGTTKIHHYVSKNPFVIIGDFRPKKKLQESLF